MRLDDLRRLELLSGLHDDQRLIYPSIEAEFEAAAGPVAAR